MNLRLRGQIVFSTIGEPVKNSIRKIAELAGISKSSTHRQIEGIKRRNLHLESHFWETPEGYRWLCRLVYATIFIFCIKCGIGAGTVSKFFMMLRIGTHVGIKTSTIRKIRNQIIEFLAKYEDAQEYPSQEKPLKVVGGVDETFFREMILVLMDLPSGYIFFEEESQTRTYETWNDKVQNILKKFNVTFEYLVSDRAKALIKLAESGIGCLSIPDLFHASNEIVKLFGIRFNRKKESIHKKLIDAILKLELLKELSKDYTQQEIVVKHHKEEFIVIESGKDRYKKYLHYLSTSVHPFDIENSSKQTSNDVINHLMTIIEDLKALQKEYEIEDTKNHISKFSKQVEAIASLIDAWWLWAEESFGNEEISDEAKEWLLYYLLPLAYWNAQVAKTKNPELREIYQDVLERMFLAFEQHPLTPSLGNNEKWLTWANWMVSNFQRTSSAVEGRNGCLSQIHHNRRGISSNYLKALTVIHNYYLERFDGTTAAERLFGKKFINPFDWLLTQMGDLPLPRCTTRGVA